MTTNANLQFLEDKWDESVAAKLDPPELLRYRSNLLGSDLRITNFGGGNTSSKLDQVDPLDGADQKILWVKGSGGDLGSIKRSGFATLYLDKLLALEKVYRGVDYEDEMVDLYPLCTFGNNPVAPSIDTPLHGFLPFAARRPPASRLGHRPGRLGQRQDQDGGVQRASSATSSPGCPGSAPALSWA